MQNYNHRERERESKDHKTATDIYKTRLSDLIYTDERGLDKQSASSWIAACWLLSNSLNKHEAHREIGISFEHLFSCFSLPRPCVCVCVQEVKVKKVKAQKTFTEDYQTRTV